MGQTLQEPPLFQEAARCVVCNTAFTTFKRRHHCRSCGKSLCNEHSANHKALPLFGLYSPVRVCDECYNSPQSVPASTTYGSLSEVEDAVASVSRLDMGSDAPSVSKEEADATADIPAMPAFDCTCGMPLCICEAPLLPKTPLPARPGVVAAKPTKVSPSASTPIFNAPLPSTQSSSKSSAGLPSLFFSNSQTLFPSSLQGPKTYEASGEGMREAVKNGDVDVVRGLLAQGVDANYRDRQGMSLLHLAAVFNFTEVVYELMEAGANVHSKNAQGETPLECAQPTLAYKMRQKMGSLVIRQ